MEITSRWGFGGRGHRFLRDGSFARVCWLPRSAGARGLGPVYGCGGAFLEKVLRERDEPCGHCVWGGHVSKREALKTAGGERVTFLLFSFAVVAGKPVPVAVGQAVAGAKELSGLLATPK